MVKVLHILSSLDGGGVERMIYNYFCHIEKSEYMFAFIVHGDKVGKLEKKFAELGCAIYHVVPKKKNYLKNIFQIKKIIKSQEWDVVYCHQGLSSFFPIIYSKICNINKRILHVHGIIKKINFFRRIKINIMCRFSTNNVACSKVVGDTFFWKKNYQVIKNAIDCDVFKFDNYVRKLTRKKLGIADNTILLLQVGRFSPEKNQIFSIDLISSLPNNYFLILVGSGDKENLTKLVSTNKIYNRVQFLDSTNNIENLYFASDCLLFPSIKEGFGMVAVEAQATGLHVIASTNVTKETKIGDSIYYLPLDKNMWIKRIVNLDFFKPNERIDKYKNLFNNKFDIGSNVEIFTKLLKGE